MEITGTAFSSKGMIKLLPTVVVGISQGDWEQRGMFNIVWPCFISHSTDSCMKMSSLVISTGC